MSTAPPRISSARSRHRFKILLAGLALLLIAAPVVDVSGAGGRAAELLIAGALAFMLVTALNAVSTSPRNFIIGTALVLPVLVLDVPAVVTENERLYQLTKAISLLALGYVLVVMIVHLFVSTEVTLDTIAAALCAFLILGVWWSIAFGLLAWFDPDAFDLPALDASPEVAMRFGSPDSSVPMYYSLVTLTTLGYGDITPRSPLARMLSASEAVMGQVFLTVLIARLVGMHIARSLGGNEEPT